MTEIIAAYIISGLLRCVVQTTLVVFIRVIYKFFAAAVE